MIHLLLILLSSLISIFVHGYQFAVTDQAIFIPFIHKIRDPSLFPGDILFEQSSASTSFFYHIVAQTTKIVDIESLFFAAYLIFQAIFFFGIYSLSKTLTNNKHLAYLGLLPFLIPKFIAGTSIFTFDTFFGYRSVGLLFFIFYLVYALANKFYRAAIVAAIGTLFHPLSFIPMLAILPALILFNSKKKAKTLLLTSALFFSISSLLIFTSSGNFMALLNHAFDHKWLEIIKFRDEYLFPSKWQPVEWASIIFYLLVIFLFFTRLKTKLKKNVFIITICCFIVFFANYVAIELIKIPLVAQLQLVRAILPIAYIAFVMSPMFLTSENNLAKALGLLVIISLSLNIYWLLVISLCLYVVLNIFGKSQKLSKIYPKFIISVFTITIAMYLILNHQSYRNLHQKFQIPKPENPWIDVQKWAITNTSVAEKFVVLPRQIGFRIYSQRSIVADLKDGAVVMYDPEYAKKWQATQKDFENFYTLSESDFQLLKGKYNFNYIVTIGEHFLNFEVAYKNSYYIVYEL